MKYMGKTMMRHEEAELGQLGGIPNDWAPQGEAKVVSPELGPWYWCTWYEVTRIHIYLGGGSKYFLFSPRKLGKIPILTNIFQRGWNHQLDTYKCTWIFRNKASYSFNKSIFKHFQYGCFHPKIGVPPNGWFTMQNWKTLLKWMIWGYPYFWKHPYIHII